MLVAEDRKDDVQILRLAAQRAKVTLPMHFVSDGEQAINYLSGVGRDADRREWPLPRILDERQKQ